MEEIQRIPLFNIEAQSLEKLLIAGTLIKVSETVSEYPATTHKLNYIFKKGTSAYLEFDTTADGTDHLLEIEPADSADFESGYYHCIIQAISLTDATEIVPIASLILNFIADPLTANDSRSFELKIIDKLETAMLALADKTMSSVSIDGRSYSYNQLRELESMRDYYKNKAGIKTETSGRKRILANFTNE